jgi:hypothetical protein
LSDPFTTPPLYTPYDPDTPTLTVEDQSGANRKVYTYPADPEIGRPTTKNGQPFDPTGSGEYFAVLKNDQNTWKYQWKDPDLETPGLIEGSFTVTAPKVT